MKFKFGEIYKCCVCHSEIEVELFSSWNGNYTELKSKYWTSNLDPLCSAKCSSIKHKELRNEKGF